MADDGDGDEPRDKPPQLPLRPRKLAGVPAPLPRDARGQLAAQRAVFTRTYLGMLQEPDIVNHIRELLTAGSARDVACLLQPLLQVLLPKEDGKGGGPVQVNLVHGVPRPPIDVTP